MNEEEKKSVNELKEEINNPVEVQGDKFNTFILYNIESAKTISNLIEKLQKENEEFKKLIVHKNEYTQKLEKDLFENASNYVIPIQKVKDKIERLSKIKGDFVTSIAVSERIKVLIELLESEEK